MAIRKNKARPSEPSQAKDDPPTAKQLAERVTDPPKLLILPNSGLSSGARFVSLADPATGRLCKYIHCPTSGFYELTKVSQQISTSSSCLVVGSLESDHDVRPIRAGYVTEEAAIYVATCFDPVFFAASLVAPGMGLDERGRPKRPETLDFFLEELSASSKHMHDLLRQPSAQTLLRQRLKSISDVRDDWTQQLYRPDAEMLLDVLAEKAASLTSPGTWPASLEQHVKRQLEVPVAAVDERSADTQEPAATSAATKGLEKITMQLRTRVALQFMLAMYIRPQMRDYLQGVLDSNLYMDNSDLDNHLKHIQQKRTEVQALRSMSDNISRKRSDLDDDEANEAREAKKRKREEDEKKRKSESRGTKELRKADVSGMKKLSSFFTKA